MCSYSKFKRKAQMTRVDRSMFASRVEQMCDVLAYVRLEVSLKRIRMIRGIIKTWLLDQDHCIFGVRFRNTHSNFCKRKKNKQVPNTSCIPRGMISLTDNHRYYDEIRRDHTKLRICK
jgi:hypothetical protein